MSSKQYDLSVDKDLQQISVFEKPSDQIILVVEDSKENYLEVKNLVRFLNGGGAFNGWTPPFFIK